MRNLSRFLFLLLVVFLSGCASWFGGDKGNVSPVRSYGVSTNNLFSSSSKNVALLLPLQGGYSSAGRAVRDGFLTAYNSASGASRPAHINIIDINSAGGVTAAYQQAVSQGANFVIGPLTKSDVQILASIANTPVPILALNYLDSSQNASVNLYQFGLSPMDEARQAAALAKQKGGQSALIIAPTGNWGPGVAQAFQNQWQALGGTISDRLFFSGSAQAVSQQLRNFLRFNQTDKKAPSTRRQDFDVIFLAASPSNARQIMPLLKYYGVSNVPVYATSLVYSGTPQPGLDNDLNGVVFCDVPWALGNRGPYPDLYQRIALFWPLDFQRNERLYALGVDAYYLSSHISELTASQKNWQGATGLLYINDQHRVVRELTCAQFHNGAPEVLR